MPGESTQMESTCRDDVAFFSSRPAAGVWGSEFGQIIQAISDIQCVDVLAAILKVPGRIRLSVTTRRVQYDGVH